MLKDLCYTDPQGQVHTLRPIVATPKKWKIKYASGNTKPAEMKAAKLGLLQRLIGGKVPSSFDNRQTHQTKATSSSDKIMVDFHTDATYNDRIPKRVPIVTDSNRSDFLAQDKQRMQINEVKRFTREVEDMRTAKRLRVEDSYQRRGIVI